MNNTTRAYVKTYFTENECDYIINYITKDLKYLGFEYYPSKLYKDEFENRKSWIYYNYKWIGKLFKKRFPVNMETIKPSKWLAFHIYENGKIRHELNIDKIKYNDDNYEVFIGDNFIEGSKAPLLCKRDLSDLLEILFEVDNLNAINNEYKQKNKKRWN